MLVGKNRDELYESDLIFGQTIHYIPDIKNIQKQPYPVTCTFSMYEGNELMELKDVTGFDHSLVFDENGHIYGYCIESATADRKVSCFPHRGAYCIESHRSLLLLQLFRFSLISCA